MSNSPLLYLDYITCVISCCYNVMQASHESQLVIGHAKEAAWQQWPHCVQERQ